MKIVSPFLLIHSGEAEVCLCPFTFAYFPGLNHRWKMKGVKRCLLMWEQASVLMGKRGCQHTQICAQPSRECPGWGQTSQSRSLICHFPHCVTCAPSLWASNCGVHVEGEGSGGAFFDALHEEAFPPALRQDPVRCRCRRRHQDHRDEATCEGGHLQWKEVELDMGRVS